MASITASSFSARTFTAQRTSELPKITRACLCSMPSSACPAVAAAPLIKASLKEKATKAFVAVTAGVLLASSAASANAIDVLMGASDGALVFLPNEFSISAGEQINFINNAGFPHNVVFDDEGVPAGVDPAAISMPDGKLLNSKDEKHSVVLTKPGEYSFYCEPHQGNGMEGKVIVK